MRSPPAFCCRSREAGNATPSATFSTLWQTGWNLTRGFFRRCCSLPLLRFPANAKRLMRMLPSETRLPQSRKSCRRGAESRFRRGFGAGTQRAGRAGADRLRRNGRLRRTRRSETSWLRRDATRAAPRAAPGRNASRAEADGPRRAATQRAGRDDRTEPRRAQSALRIFDSGRKTAPMTKSQPPTYPFGRSRDTPPGLSLLRPKIRNEIN